MHVAYRFNANARMVLLTYNLLVLYTCLGYIILALLYTCLGYIILALLYTCLGYIILALLYTCLGYIILALFDLQGNSPVQ